MYFFKDSSNGVNVGRKDVFIIVMFSVNIGKDSSFSRETIRNI